MIARVTLLSLLVLGCAGEVDPAATPADTALPQDAGSDAWDATPVESDAAGLVADAEPGCEPEACNGEDDDCDGRADEGHPDTDGDGMADCIDEDDDDDGFPDGDDCGPTDRTRNPNAPEVFCNGLDEDCDGSVDERVSRSCYEGPGGTASQGRCSAGRQTCRDGAWGACEAQVLPTEESCDGADEDCDGTTDEGLVRSCYGGPEGTEGIGRCAGGEETCVDGAWSSCVDSALPVEETCNGADEDCDGSVDEDLERSCYDGPEGTDDNGLCQRGVQGCAGGEWGACDGQVLPGEEVCDLTDEDCDGSADEGLERYWLDRDEDGFGDGAQDHLCEAGEGRVDNPADCDDSDSEIHPDAADVPDLDFVDGNCDGIDGDALLHVAAGAPPGGDGTRGAPFQAISEALEVAEPGGHVAVAAGQYVGPLTLADGISIHGGYGPDWQRSPEHLVVVTTDAPNAEGDLVGLRAGGIAQATSVELLTVRTADHPAAGGSTYGAWIQEAPGLALRQVTLTPGAGGDGQPGVAGDPGGNGDNGGQGGNCGGDSGGGGSSACGDGGSGGRGQGVGDRGDDGQPEGCGGRGGSPGGAGAGDDGRRGCDGALGENGADGAAGELGSLDGLGRWRTPAGANGGPGAAGAPGGGGGGGGGGAVIPGDGGSGGGAGGSGCGGSPGTGGQGGGASLALVAVDSTGMVLEACTLQPGRGGAGGAGAPGGPGGVGGLGAGGGTGREAFACGGLAAAGHGGDGGNGGDGGRGGHSGGGSGGASYGAVCLETALPLDQANINLGAGGPGGPSDGNAGPAGAAGEAVGCEG